MKKHPILQLIAIFCLTISTAQAQSVQTGKLLESLQMKSQILGKEVKYCVYLPADYATSQRRYPVVYLLHGYSDDETGWVQFGEANLIADKGIATGEIPPMIIVMPDAGVTWYVNDYQGKNKYEDMFIKELIPYVDATYRTRNKREFRAISGLSMGGHGALLYAMHHPELFSVCAAFSSAIYTEDNMATMPEAQYNTFFTDLFGIKATGKARLTDSWHKNSPLELAKTLPEDGLKQIQWFMDCGDDDFLYDGNAMMHVTLRNRNIPHEFRVRDGAHNWTYWRTSLPEGLKFIGQRFHR
ncbi:MAG: alpha/beta hydrolase family protein [Bacteroidota bacterium]